ncbi:MAG: HAD family hydrolase [Candidatus Woesearchaeota archaeon]|nr:MAG: HAD family hydrolase [Candidatus Woesearchaeota archaeon]
MLKAIIFDFDGVIHDTFELYYKLHLNFSPDSTREYYRSRFEENIFKHLKKKNVSKETQEKFRELEYEAFKDLKLEREIREEIEELSKKYSLFIITSNSQKNLDLYFENNKFTGVFKQVLAEEAHTSKSEKFKTLFAEEDFSKDECVFVTDTLGDIREAHEVGVRSIACTFGFHEEERLRKGNPFKIISDFKEIQRIVETL